MRKNKAALIGIVVLAFAGINCLSFPGPAGQLFIKGMAPYLVKWRDFYSVYVLLFTFGLLLPCFLTPRQSTHPLSAKLVSCLLPASTIGFMMLLKYYVTNMLFFAILPLPALALLFIHFLRHIVKFRFLAYLGSISYSVYLFHILYYKTIDRICSAQALAIQPATCVALFPLFLYACNKLEELGKYIARKSMDLPPNARPAKRVSANWVGPS
jgi:peptidoglycan/LPS O-acetylase OafA/YrhL